MDVFIVIYGTTVGVVVSIFRTQAEATAKAADDADLTSITGAKTWAQGQRIGVAYYDGTDILDERPLPTSGLELRKNSAQGLHEQLLVWRSALIAEGVSQPISATNIGHDFLTYGHHACYLVFNSATWTETQQIAWAAEMATGASDVTTPFEFFERVHTLSAMHVPTSASAWVNPDDAVAVTMITVVENSDIWFLNEDRTLNDTHLADGAWIEDLT